MATLFPNPKMRFFDANGDPLNGGKIYTYAAGTSTPLDTYTTYAGSTPNANPVILNSEGYADIWLGAALYKIVVKTSADVTISTTDNIGGQANVADLANTASSTLGDALIGVKSTLTGGTALTQHAKNAQIVSVKDFGALGDGATNDSAAVQAAIDSTAAGIYFPAGTYLLSTQLTGAGSKKYYSDQGAILKAGATMNSILYLLDVSNVEICGLEFNGNSNTLSNIRAYTNSATQTNLNIHHCTSYSTKTDATLQYGNIEVSKLASSRWTKVRICNNDFRTSGTHGSIVAYADGVMFTDNLVSTATNHGFEAVDCTNVIEKGNVVSDCTLSGLGVGTHCKNWIIQGNVISNCGGDGSITAEHNSVDGIIDGNVIFDCNTQGINVSFGTAIAAPFDKVQNIIVSNNNMVCKSGVTTKIGINAYSSTGGSAVGTGVKLANNVIDGFNVGIAYAYFAYGDVTGNTVKNLTGSSSVAIKGTFVASCNISDNLCNTDSGDHSIQLLTYSGNICDRCVVNNNMTLAAGTGTKALVYIEGTGTHTVNGNFTGGATYYVQCAAAAVMTITGNQGPIATASYSASGVINAAVNGNNSLDFLVFGGKKHYFGTAAPVAGTWAQGDIVWNTAAAAGGIPGFYCVTAGTPGTWKNMAAVAA